MVAFGEKVKVHYRGTLDDGRQFDSSYDRDEPLEFTVGSGQMIPGFDKAVFQMGVGERRTVRLEPAEAYGDYDDALIESVSRASIPFADSLVAGETVTLGTPVGPLRVKVLEVSDEVVRFDHNHELAGKALTFDIEVVEVVRESAVERERHGAGCACGCHEFKDALTRQNAVERFLATHNMSEVRIWTIDAPSNQLVDEAGNRFEEVETNLWAKLQLADGEERCMVYLGTGKHGDRITLRPLYVKTDDGCWRNVQTGAPAPFDDARTMRW